MERETITERAIRSIKSQRGGRQLIALRAGVDVADVDKLTDERDERVVDAILSLTGNGGKIRAVDTSVKKFIEKIIRAAAWDKRMYGIYGRTGVGKTFAVNSVIEQIEEPIAFVRVNETNKQAKARLLDDIHSSLYRRIKKSAPPSYVTGHTMFQRMMNLVDTQRAVIILDEAQRLSEGSFELLRDVYDMTQVSIVLIGSIVFEGRIGTNKIDDEIFGQSLRRMDSRYELPHATPNDVILFLGAYGIEIDKPEAKQIAKRIGEFGDIDTLARAMRIISGSVEGGELSWRKVGSGQIIEAIERVRTITKVKDNDDDASNKS